MPDPGRKTRLAAAWRDWSRGWTKHGALSNLTAVAARIGTCSVAAHNGRVCSSKLCKFHACLSDRFSQNSTAQQGRAFALLRVGDAVDFQIISNPDKQKRVKNAHIAVDVVKALCPPPAVPPPPLPMENKSDGAP